jgi:hypothetical protein
MENQVDENSTSKASKVLFIIVIALGIFVIAGYALIKAFPSTEKTDKTNKIGNLINESDSTYEVYETSNIMSIDLTKTAEIKEDGTYLLNGVSQEELKITSTGTVTLKLNGIEVPKIISSASKLILVLEENAEENKISYISGEGNVFIQGKGKLKVENGISSLKKITIHDGNIYLLNKISASTVVINNGTISLISDNESIVAQEGYTINGGTVLLLGNGTISNPLSTSKQNIILFNLDNKIEKDKILSLASDSEILTFTSEKEYKTIAISTPLLVNGTYYLYNGKNNLTSTNGIYLLGGTTYSDKIAVNNISEFIVNSSISEFGYNN